MKTIATIVCTLAIAAQALAATTTEKLDAYLTARTNLSQFSGSVLIATGGKVVLRKGYGYANLEHLVPATPETKYEIASLTKAFTAYAALDLARAGKLRLDASMCDYTESCPEAWKPITVAQLIHHTSGIPDYEEELGMATPKYFEQMSQYTVRELVDQAQKKPLDFAPGSKFKYSNTAYLALGLILEKASGKTFEQYLKERVFDRFSLLNTVHANRERVERHRADGYTHRAPLDELVAGFPLTATHLKRVPPIAMDPPQADGGLLSTVDDLYKWAQAIRGDADLFVPSLEGYAYGWFAGTRHDRKRIFHNGVLPGFVSTFDIYPESDTVIIVLSNLDRTRTSAVLRDLTNILFDKPYDVPRSHRVGRLSAEQAARFLGDYKLDDGRIMTIGYDPKERYLSAEIRDQFVAGILPESDLVYYAVMWEGTVTFVPEGNSVPRLVVHMYGKDIKGERIKP